MYELPTISYHGHHSPMGSTQFIHIGTIRCGVWYGQRRKALRPIARFMGYRSASGIMNSFPFFKEMENEAERFVQSDEDVVVTNRIFTEDEIERTYGWATDQFGAPGIRFSIFTPFEAIPDPPSATPRRACFASCPGTMIELRLKIRAMRSGNSFLLIMEQRHGCQWRGVMD